MKLKIDLDLNPRDWSWKQIIKVALVVILIIVCVRLFPTHINKFNYKYAENQPWGYSTLVARQNIVVPKTQAEIDTEYKQDLALSKPKVVKKDISDNLVRGLVISDHLAREIHKKLHNIYDNGVIAEAMMQKLKDSKIRQVNMNGDNILGSKNVTDLYTPQTAADELEESIKKAIKDEKKNRFISPDGYRKDSVFLSQNKIINLVQTNLTLDWEGHCKKVRENVNKDGSTIKKGEVVVEKGQIVNTSTYYKLKAMDKVMNNSKATFATYMADYFLVIFFVALFILYFMKFRPDILKELKNVVFFCCTIGTVVILSCLTIGRMDWSIYIIPFAWIPIITCAFYDSRTAFMAHLTTILIVSLIVPTTFDFLLVQILVGLVTVNSLSEITQRSQLGRSTLFIVLTYAFSYTAIHCTTTGGFATLQWMNYLYFLINGLFIIFAYGLIYLCEKAFGYVSSMTLVELTNINSGLMAELADKAPGTFQHCMQVSNLAVEGAKVVKADALLVRTGAMYHDIGKLAHPEYFTENQQHGNNPLSKLPCDAAARVILAHVTDGVKMAEKKHLPKKVIEFIKTHHGTTLVRYFYNTYVNTHPNEKVDASLFQYAGPKPQTKEHAILMMADAVEARSRSLAEYTEESVGKMVEQMITAQVSEGQFSETALTFKDIEDIKRVFKQKLLSMNHHRVSYPELKK